MKKDSLLYQLLMSTGLAVMLFCTISFLQLISQLSPFSQPKAFESYRLRLGVPMSYYEQFWLSGSSSPNFSWSISGLLYDFVLTWSLVAIINIFINRSKNQP